MSKTKRSGLRGQALRNVNSQIAILREKGLYSGKPARGQPTKYAISQTKRFADVISGKAAVVKVPSKSARQKYAAISRAEPGAGIKVKGNKVIVKKLPQNSERARYDKKTGEIVIHGDSISGKRYTKRPGVPGDQIPPPPPGQVNLYTVPMGHGRSPAFDHYPDLANFLMHGESPTLRKNAVNLLRYVEVTTLDDDSDIEF